VSAFDRLEDAAIRCGLGAAAVAVNRRQRDEDGQVRKIGWNPDGLVDRSVPVLQSVRTDGSAVATVVGYGAHTVTTGVEFLGCSPDYAGPAERVLAEAEARGAPESELRVFRFHGLNWARRAEAEIAAGNPRTAVGRPISAIRIGDTAIVNGPGEVFTEIGLAVKERSPADVTFYAGYSNGCISYMPTAAEYPLGGYEPTYGHKTYGLPAQVAPETERLLVETGVRLAASLFPDRVPPRIAGWLATGTHPVPPSTPPPARTVTVTSRGLTP
jgi:hypothetical protein